MINPKFYFTFDFLGKINLDQIIYARAEINVTFSKHALNVLFGRNCASLQFAGSGELNFCKILK